MAQLSKDQIQSALNLLETVSADPNAQPFLEPVDWQELDLLDYPKIVKNPMDLGTVKAKLLKGEYQTLEEFIAQIQLIWDNCKSYNMAGSVIYKICERMERSYNRELSKFKISQGLTNTSGNVSSSKRNAKQVVDDGQNAESIVTNEMKKDLCQRIRKLPSEQLTKFAARVQQVQSSSFVEVESEKVQIRVDDWSRSAFDQISGYVDELIVGLQHPSKRQKTGA